MSDKRIPKAKQKGTAAMYYDLWRHLKNKCDRDPLKKHNTQCICDDCRQRRQLAAKLNLPHVGEIDASQVRLKKSLCD